ncbi:MAG: hypothetical protein QM490_03910 [Candidatus Gracilibacteria bacterium]
MDFKAIKEKVKANAIKLKNKAFEQTEKAINYSAKKLSNSKFTLETKKELDIIIKKSTNTSFKNKETGKETINKHRSLVIFADEGSEFFKESLYALPIMATKAFTQSIPIKLAKSKIEGVNLADYNVKEDALPCLVVFEDGKVIKNIEGSKNILKLVKSFHLDINKLIDKA